MISDNYLTETATNLHELGYRAAFMEDIFDGANIVIMEKDFSEGEATDIIQFLKVFNLRKSPQFTYNERGDSERTGSLISFIGEDDNGITKPFSFGSSWGIYIKKG